MNKKLQNAIIGISVLIPFGLSLSGMKNEMGKSALLYSVMWGLINYLFIMTAVDFISKYKNISKLPGLKIRKRTYYINIFVYIGFLFFVNIYFLQQMYFRNVDIINTLASPIFIVGLFLLFLFNLQNGKFLIKDEKETDIYEIPKKHSFRNGNDVLGNVVGSYENGLVLGNYYFPYEGMKSISKSKENEVIIKGKDDSKNYIVKVGSKNSENQLISEIKDALEKGKIEENKVNLKKLKNF